MNLKKKEAFHKNKLCCKRKKLEGCSYNWDHKFLHNKHINTNGICDT